MRLIAIIIAGLLLAQTGIAEEESGGIEPGNFLYPLKIWLEKFSLNFVFNQTEKAQKMLDMADKRLIEAETMENNTGAFEIAMGEYAEQLEELQDFIKRDTDNRTENTRSRIKGKIEEHKNRTRALKSTGKVSIIQQSIIEASSSSGESTIKVSVVDGNVSVYTEGGNATVTRDGGNVTVVSVTNNSRQLVIIKSTRNQSSSSSVTVVQSDSTDSR